MVMSAYFCVSIVPCNLIVGHRFMLQSVSNECHGHFLNFHLFYRVTRDMHNADVRSAAMMHWENTCFSNEFVILLVGFDAPCAAIKFFSGRLYINNMAAQCLC